MKTGKVCVLGAGVVGLTTAVKLQQQFPDIEVESSFLFFSESELSKIYFLYAQFICLALL